LREHRATNTFITILKGDVAVFSSRAKTGFGGMITVSAVLLVIQFLTSVQAFPR
jgi:hypothetical protein